MNRSGSIQNILVLIIGILVMTEACAAPPGAQKVAPTATLSQTAMTESPRASASFGQVPTPGSHSLNRDIFPTQTPRENVTPTASATIGSAQVISGTPDADPKVASLINTALDKTLGMKSYLGQIKYIIGQRPVENWIGRVNGDAVHYKHLADPPLSEIEVILKDGKHYERSYQGQYGLWREIPNSQLKDNSFHVPTEILADLVFEIGSYRKKGTFTIGTQLCDVYSHQLDASIRRALYKVSDTLHSPLSDQLTGGFDRTSASIFLCPDGYIHQAGIDFTPKKNLKGGYISVALQSFNPAIDAPVIISPTPTRTPRSTFTPTIHPAQVIATMQAGATLAQQPEEWPIAFTDWDQENLHGWQVGRVQGSTTSFNIAIVGDIYRWEANSTEGYYAQRTIRTFDPKDFYLTADVRRVKGPRNAAYGIVFRAGPDGYYEFRLRDEPARDGMSYFSLTRRGANGDTILVPDQPTYAVRKGEVNELGVLSQGDQISISINDQWIGSVQDNSLRAGRFGVFTQMFEAGDAIFEFSELVLRVP